MADIKLSNVVKRFGDIQTIHNVDLAINNGEFVVFVGPSGCGKSTLLRLIAGLEEITSGDIYIEDTLVNDVDPAERGVAMVFQTYALYPHMTVEENMGFGLKMNNHPKAEIKKQVAAAAKTLQLDHLLSRKPKELSGGQRQRVAIGRAIVRNPKVFLFDEPLSNLDAELRVEMRLQIAKLHQELENTMVYVTHDQVEAMTLADKIVVLRDGRVEQVGSPLELYHFPQNEFVAGFIGSPKMNFVPVLVNDVNISEQIVKVELADGQCLAISADGTDLTVGQTLKLGVRPEHIELKAMAEDAVAIAFKSDVVERLGNSTYMFGSFAGSENFKIHIPNDAAVTKGQSIKAYFELSRVHLFDQDGLSIRAYNKASIEQPEVELV